MTGQPDSQRSAMNLAELERLQCSCELHDGILQYLIGARMQLEALRYQVRSGNAITEEQLLFVEEILQRGTREGRNWIGELRGDSFHQQESIAESIKRLIQDAKKQYEVPTIVAHVDPQIDHVVADAEVRLAIYRIVQESLHNALRHSRATQIQVDVQTEYDMVKVRIADDGRGFRPETVPQDHFGLIGMRTRAAMTSGDFQLQTIPDQGTTISVTWKVPTPQGSRSAEPSA
jgi:signal transduction histidine kinase